MTHLTTQRLTLTPAQLSDVPMLFSFLGDRSVMRHTYCHTSLKDCRHRIITHERLRIHDGCAPWVVRLTYDNAIIGYGGLFIDPFERGWGVELGYFFHPRAWGNGYCAELAQAAIAEADNTLKLPRLTSFAHPLNRRSRRVLENAGFRETRFEPKLQRYVFHRPRHGAGATQINDPIPFPNVPE